MKNLLAVASLVVLAGGLALAQDDAAAAIKKDKEVLKGTWKFESVEHEQGKKDDFNDATLTFAGDNIDFAKGGDTKKASYTINPAGKPKEIDLKPEGKDEAMQGIYRIEKETLTICIAEGKDAARPTEFAAKGKNVLVTLKRAKN